MTEEQSVEARINEHLERRNLELEAQVLALNQAMQFAKPDPQVQQTLVSIGQYMPQLTQMTTNLSYLASHVQTLGNNQIKSQANLSLIKDTQERIADASENQARALTKIASSFDRLVELAEGVREEAWRANLTKP